MCEALTYGSAPSPFPSLGIGYKLLTGNAISLGYVPYIGDGTAVLSAVSLPSAVLWPFFKMVTDSGVS